VNADKEFQAIKKFAGTIRAHRSTKTQTIPLKADSFEQWARQHQLEPGITKNNISVASKKFIVDNHGLDKSLLVNNRYAKEINNGWLDNIAADMYVQETFSVLCDLVNLQQLKN